jgi:hypothetical protein
MLAAAVVFSCGLIEHRNYIGIEKNENALLHKVKSIDYIKFAMKG